MIVHFPCAKVGHRQAPQHHKPSTSQNVEGFVRSATQINAPNNPEIQAFSVFVVLFVSAGLPALQGGEPGQVRKEAATAIYCECRGKARHLQSMVVLRPLPV